MMTVTTPLMTRDVSGILILDKPAGVTSNGALQRVKRLFQAAKAGHTGSLDPLATGMLPVCLGQATKVSQFLLSAHKSYHVVAQLGAATDTGDADGSVTGTAPVPTHNDASITEKLQGFLGQIDQVPPMYSALKHKGQRLYLLARRGQNVARPARQVTISAIRLLSYSGLRVTFTVDCSKGTYVRSLVEDLGAALGTLAHVAALRRLSVDPFEAEPMHSLESLDALAGTGLSALDEVLLPVDRGIRDWPRVDLSAAVCARLAQGQKVAAQPGWPEARVRVYGPDSDFVGIGEVAAGELAPRRLFPAIPGSR